MDNATSSNLNAYFDTPPSVPDSRLNWLHVSLVLIPLALLLGIGIALFANNTFRSGSDKIKEATPTPFVASPTPSVSVMMNNAVLYMTPRRHLAFASPQGKQLKDITNEQVLSGWTVEGAAVSSDYSKVFFTAIEDPLNYFAPNIATYVMDSAGEDIRKIDTDKMEKEIGEHEYIVFWTWTSDSKSLVFEAVNGLVAGDSGPSEKIVGLYNVSTGQITPLFSKNALYLGDIHYDTTQGLVYYWEGWGSFNPPLMRRNLSTGTDEKIILPSDQHPLELSPNARYLVAMNKSSNIADSRTFFVYALENLSVPYVTVQLDQPEPFVYERVPNPIWSADGSLFAVFSSSRASAAAVDILHVYTPQGRQIVTMQMNDGTERLMSMGEGIFSKDNKSFLFFNELIGNGKPLISWQVVDLQTKTKTGMPVIDSTLGKPFAWMKQ